MCGVPRKPGVPLTPEQSRGILVSTPSSTMIGKVVNKRVALAVEDTSKPAVVNHEQGSQDSNNLKTKDESSFVLRETVASAIRVAPSSSKSSSGGSGGSSNPASIHPKAKSIYTKKEIPKEDRIWTIIPGCPRCKRDSFETRISKCTMTKMNEKHMDQGIGTGWCTISIEREISIERIKFLRTHISLRKNHSCTFSKTTKL